MGKVILDMSMSLDGFIVAPNDNAQEPLGEGGQRLHEWLFKDKAVFDEVYDELFKSTGAVIIGRRTYDNGQGPDGWDGKGPLGDVPCFVLSHDVPEKAGAMFTFVTDGIESALRQAKAVAGDKNIGLMGANVDQQYLKAGLVDEIIHSPRTCAAR
jgi:dihydrofolate reductase